MMNLNCVLRKWLWLLPLSVSWTLAAETVVLVENGKLTGHAVAQGGWKETGTGLENSGIGQRLLFRDALKGDRFLVEGKLSLDNPGHTAAGLSLGNEIFGFDGAKGCFVEGGALGQVKHFPGTKIEAGKPFTFQVEGKGGTVTFRLNGRVLTTEPLAVETLSGIGLRPQRAKMRVLAFSVTGTVQERKKLNHIFACGVEGYKSYRIPSMVTTKAGTLLAFCEGRKHGAGDHGDIDIVMKRSTNHGKTWSPLQQVADNGNHVAGNQVPIVDQKSGRVYLLSCSSETSEGAIYGGNGRRGIWIQHSDDDGVTWSERRDISAGIYPQNWRWYALGPCSGIQIQQGKHAGRLVCPANHSAVEDGSEKMVFRAHCIYSDDAGVTWKLGESSALGGNESSIAEAGENVLFHSIRMQSHRKGLRGTRYSQDGGATWTELQHEPGLPCPMCQGAVIRDFSKPQRLFHSNPGTSTGRKEMTIRASEDGGKTWPFAKVVWPGSSAYSSICLTADGQVGILYEGGHADYAQEGIIFQRHVKEEILGKR